MCYQHGRGVEADSIRAIELYTLSINKGNRKLFDNHLELASKGSVFSNVFLAMCYQKGIGTSRDIQKCVEHYQAASQLNSPDAQRELGLLCMTVNKPEKAVNYFKSAAEKEDLTSVYYYGQLLFDGKGIEKDEAEGLIYMLKAAEANFAQAQYAVGPWNCPSRCCRRCGGRTYRRNGARPPVGRSYTCGPGWPPP